MKHYHYIFAGAGLAALMTVYEMIVSGEFTDKTILLIDENSKKTNDRTWCFWDDANLYDTVVSKRWDFAWFKNNSIERRLELLPYRYKMVNGLDFYNLVLSVIAKQSNIQILQQKVISIQDLGQECIVSTEIENYSCSQIFNSIFNSELIENQAKYPFLHQHFIGWKIRSKEAVFTPECATFMDFSVAQKQNTRFMYVLPFSKNEALLEYTLFSQELLLREEYEMEIKNYIKKIGISDFEIIEKEEGNIPMTCFPFWNFNSRNIMHIGSAGGWTKASTGYTFKNTTKKSKLLAQFLSKENDLRKFYKVNKFWFYDLLLLDILDQKNEMGSMIFSSMFQKGDATILFKFLDEETSFWEDLHVIWKCPKGLFISALFKRLFN